MAATSFLTFSPPLIGHRGARADAPENTLAAVREAHAQGVLWVEVDVKLTHDGIPVIMHDDTLERTTNGHGAVRDSDAAALRQLDAGSWFNAGFAGEKVPTLAEMLRLVLDLGMAINLEIKPCPGRERETALCSLQEAAKLWPTDRPPPLVSSFAVESLRVAQDLMPDWPRGLLLENLDGAWQPEARRLAVATINVDHESLTPARLASLREFGLPILAYTVNKPERAQALLRQGVDALFTDCPAAILATLA